LYFFVFIFNLNFGINNKIQVKKIKLSHIPQRKEKDCLNCGTTVFGKYCHVCGQENVEPKESFWHMVTHFFNDITHFDGSFFTTLKDLLFKPGFLSKEYMKGRRASYLHPVRMYVFTSAIFFLLFFSLFKPVNVMVGIPGKPFDARERAEYLDTLQARLKKDSVNEKLREAILKLKDNTRPFTDKDKVKKEAGNGINNKFSEKEFKSFEEYDSTEKTLPPSKRDGWLTRRFVKLEISLSNKYRENPDELGIRLLEGFFHRLPYMLFVSLP